MSTGINTSPLPILTSVPGAARMVSLSRSRIYELINEGRIKSVKDGKRRLILVASLHEFVASLSATNNVATNGGWTVV